MARGSLIVFEGLDRAGKSTQCEMLADALRRDGLKVRHMRFPGMSHEFGSWVNISVLRCICYMERIQTYF